MTHPHDVDPSWHKTHVIFYSVNRRRDRPDYYHNRLDRLAELTDALEKRGVPGLAKNLEPYVDRPEHMPFYVEAFSSGIYPQIYDAMRSFGIKIITVEEADKYISGELPWPFPLS